MPYRGTTSPRTPVALLGLGLAAACSDGGASTTAGSPSAPVSGEADQIPVDPDHRAAWPIYRGGTSLHGLASGELSDSFELLWTYPTGGPITSSPVVSEGRVFVGSDDFHLHAIDLSSGERVWAFLTEDIIEAPPLVHAGTIFVGSSDFYFYAIDEGTGELRWKHETDDRILGSANWTLSPEGETRILVGSYDTHLYCFDAETGDVVWRYQTDSYVNGCPAVLGGRVVFGGCDAGLHVVSTGTGERIARIDLGQESYVAGSVGLADGRAYFGHYGNAFVCIDIDGGQVVWTYPDPEHAFFSSPAIGEDRIVFGGRDRGLHCVRRSDGERLWRFQTRRKVDASPVICGDRVVFGSGDGRLYLLDLETGEEVWTYEIGQSIFSSPAVVDGLILVGSNDGRLYAFGPRGCAGKE